MVHISERTGLHDVSQSVRSNDIKVAWESSHSYQFVLSTTSLNKIETRVAFQEPVPMQVPDHLNAWFYAAAKAYAIQNGSLCRYTVPIPILMFLTSPRLSTSCATIDPQLILELLPERKVESEQLRPLLAHISEGWIAVDLETQESFERIVSWGATKLRIFGHAPKEIYKEMPLAYAAVLAWHWLIETKVISSHLKSAEITEGLLHGMIAAKEEAEYFASCMDSWVHAKPTDLSKLSIRRKGTMKEVTKLAKATYKIEEILNKRTVKKVLSYKVK